jgi:hypothetical protein
MLAPFPGGHSAIAAENVTDVICLPGRVDGTPVREMPDESGLVLNRYGIGGGRRADMRSVNRVLVEQLNRKEKKR